MKIKIDLISENKFKIPVGYNSLIQKIIYDYLDDNDSNWLHNTGFSYKNRKYKLFAFSLFLERALNYDKINREFEFPKEVSFYISSPVDWILQQFVQNVLSEKFIKIDDVEFLISSISVIDNGEVDSEKIEVKTITPITVHSNSIQSENKKKTNYLNPFDPDFEKLVNDNLRNKWAAFYGSESSHDLKIKPNFKNYNQEKISYFGIGKRGTLVKGWTGHFFLSGNSEFLKFALDVGLGPRNSQGFGMVDIVHRQEFKKNEE